MSANFSRRTVTFNGIYAPLTLNHFNLPLQGTKFQLKKFYILGRLKILIFPCSKLQNRVSKPQNHRAPERCPPFGILNK
jgi:hypothetical protein